MSGARVGLVEFQFADLINKLLTSFASGIHVADILQFGAVWMADIMGGGHLLRVPPAIQEKLVLADLVPANREWLLSWGGVMYGLPYDGDYHLNYYRRDAFENPDNMKKFKTDFGYDLGPPATWNQYNDQAKFFNNWDWNNRGKPSYGSCEEMARAGRLHWFTQSRAAAYASARTTRTSSSTATR